MRIEYKTQTELKKLVEKYTKEGYEVGKLENITEGKFVTFESPSPFDQLTATVQEIKRNAASATAKYDILSKDEAPIEEFKKARIAKLKEECSNEIYEGFTSGENEFGFNEQDQVNFTQQLLLIVSGQTSDIQWKTKNAGVQTFTPVEFQEIIADAAAHKLVQQNKYWEKEILILAAETNEEVDSVIWE